MVGADAGAADAGVRVLSVSHRGGPTRRARVTRRMGRPLRRPIDDSDYVVVDLEFASTEQATGFLEFLRSRGWSNPAASPALIGVPRTMILDTAARE